MTPAPYATSTFRVETLDAPYHRTMLQHDFALIDPTRVEEDARADLCGCPIVPKGREDSADTCPLLVELGILSSTARVDLLDRMAAWQSARGVPYFSALLDSTYEAKVLQRHLAHRSSIRTPDGRNAWLRYHDPRVFQYLPWILRPDQLSVLLADIRRWTWPGVGGKWRSLVREDNGPGHRMGLLRIDPDQLPNIHRMASITAVLAALARTTPELEQDAQLAQAVNIRLAEAESMFSLGTTDARRLYAEHAIRFGDNLFRHPDMQNRLTPVYAGQQSYLLACADLDDETLHAWTTTYPLDKERT